MGGLGVALAVASLATSAAGTYSQYKSMQQQEKALKEQQAAETSALKRNQRLALGRSCVLAGTTGMLNTGSISDFFMAQDAASTRDLSLLAKSQSAQQSQLQSQKRAALYSGIGGMLQSGSNLASRLYANNQNYSLLK